jgi:ubiquinone/menaquinone biosynthesis C-methylase UbiE
MPRVEYEDRGFWERKWTAEEIEKEAQEEESWIEGVDGEDYFDRMVLKEARGKSVLDVGCGRGEFTLSVATVATKVRGVDFSRNAISWAIVNTSLQGVTNVELRLADAGRIPYPDEAFDLVYSRRGPATYSLKTTREGRRVLKQGGQLIQEEIGEKDKLNWKQIFRRGQNYPFKESVSTEKRKLLARAGFRKTRIKEFEASEFYDSIKDVVMRLETTPIIPNFSKTRDRKHLQDLEKKCSTGKGIETNTHRVIVVATNSLEFFIDLVQKSSGDPFSVRMAPLSRSRIHG